MIISFVENLRRSANNLLGRNKDEAIDFAPPSRTQATFTIAASLVGKVEKKDYNAAINELMILSQEDRVSVAEKMVSINKQHRSIISSLPTVKFSYLTLRDGSRDVEFLQIYEDTSTAAEARQSFCFRQDYCFYWTC